MLPQKAYAKFENVTHDAEPLRGGLSQQQSLHIERAHTGDLAGRGHGELMTYQISSSEFAYVGMDHFVGSLNGWKGEFVFLHGEVNDNGKINPFGMIIPGSGSGALRTQIVIHSQIASTKWNSSTHSR